MYVCADRYATWPMLTKFDIKHPWVKGFQVVFSEEGPRLFPKWDNNETANIRWQTSKILFCQDQFQPKLTEDTQAIVSYMGHLRCNNVALPYFIFWYLPSPRNIKILKKSETATMSQLGSSLLTNTKKGWPMYEASAYEKTPLGEGNSSSIKWRVMPLSKWIYCNSEIKMTTFKNRFQSYRNTFSQTWHKAPLGKGESSLFKRRAMPSFKLI